MDSAEIVVVASPFANLAPMYEVDPDADTLLIVPPLTRPFAPWDRDGHQISDGGADSKHKAVSSRPGLRIKVSSQHLALVSRVFKTKLQFGGSKSSARQADGRIHLQLAEGFDGNAVSIVMNAIHSRGSKVPKSVDIETLARIALFVDRLQLLDAVEIYADRWISKLEATIPATYDRDLTLWLYISHVFRQPAIFKAVTITAALHAPGPFPTLNLPIREKIIQHIETQRHTLLTTALSHIHQTLDDLMAPSESSSLSSPSSPSSPSSSSSSLLLGELIKALQGRHRLVWPRPARPFEGISFASTVLVAVEDVLRLHRQRREMEMEVEREREREFGGGGGGGGGEKSEVEPWYMHGVGVTTAVDAQGQQRVAPVTPPGSSGTGAGGDMKPGWGAVGGRFPVTPAASPEPVYRSGPNGVGRFEGHECGVERAVQRLEGLGRLADGVDGLVLEGNLGYRLY
ncbi:hypothetical protein N658DRAFT_526328 [Parathielavia hyrcaniae]|uniref:BTB domain-containing protein n=1 Tax=Parathielavia hyrcaniae TaxID=113614 RepID=A0AAN6PYJ5_9PEZI|nr:hypothetical protein N658DRAFT_526328 [Parathielavia hyrcaniae]